MLFFMLFWHLSAMLAILSGNAMKVILIDQTVTLKKTKIKQASKHAL